MYVISIHLDFMYMNIYKCTVHSLCTLYVHVHLHVYSLCTLYLYVHVLCKLYVHMLSERKKERHLRQWKNEK